MGTVEKFTTRIQAPAANVHQAVYAALIARLDAVILDGGNPLRADVPRAIRKNRWGAQVTAEVVPAGDTATDVHWAIDLTGDKHRAILDDVLADFPYPGTITAMPPPKPTFREAMAEAQAKAEAKAAERPMTFNGLRLTPSTGTLSYQGNDYPVAGAHAEVEVGAPNRRVTATRVVAIGVFALAAKKDKTKIFLSVELADGQALIVEGSAKKDESAARTFAAAVNSAAAQDRSPLTPPSMIDPLQAQEPQAQEPRAQRVEPEPRTPQDSLPFADLGTQAAPAPAAQEIPPPPPPPPSVPAGWYPDAESPVLQRYWDGTAWTEHTAPLAPK